MRFNPPPGWPSPPDGWTPPPGWNPDPSWPAPPDGWQQGTWRRRAAARERQQVRDQLGAALAGLADRRQRLLRGRHAADDPPTAPVAAHAAAADTAVLLTRIAELEAALAAQITGREVIELSDQRVLQDVGIYRYHHPLENAVA